jgi:hypothetical protein
MSEKHAAPQRPSQDQPKPIVRNLTDKPISDFASPGAGGQWPVKLVLARPFPVYVYYRFIRHSHLEKSVPHSDRTSRSAVSRSSLLTIRSLNLHNPIRAPSNGRNELSKATTMVNVLEASAFILGIIVAARWLYSAAGLDLPILHVATRGEV